MPHLPMCREDQELQGRQAAAADSFRTKLLSRSGLFAWRQVHAQLLHLQVPSSHCTELQKLLTALITYLLSGLLQRLATASSSYPVTG